MKLEITSISLEGHDISVPAGLSELLSNGNAWSKDRGVVNPAYEREVVKESGKLVTFLRKR